MSPYPDCVQLRLFPAQRELLERVGRVLLPKDHSLWGQLVVGNHVGVLDDTQPASIITVVEVEGGVKYLRKR